MRKDIKLLEDIKKILIERLERDITINNNTLSAYPPITIVNKPNKKEHKKNYDIWRSFSYTRTYASAI